MMAHEERPGIGTYSIQILMEKYGFNGDMLSIYNRDVNAMIRQVENTIMKHDLVSIYPSFVGYSHQIKTAMSCCIGTATFLHGMKSIGNAMLSKIIFAAIAKVELFPRWPQGRSIITLPVASFLSE